MSFHLSDLKGLYGRPRRILTILSEALPSQSFGILPPSGFLQEPHRSEIWEMSLISELQDLQIHLDHPAPGVFELHSSERQVPEQIHPQILLFRTSLVDLDAQYKIPGHLTAKGAKPILPGLPVIRPRQHKQNPEKWATGVYSSQNLA